MEFSMKGSGWERNKLPLKLGGIIHLSRVKKHEMLKKLHLTQFLLRLDTGEKKERKKNQPWQAYLKLP